MDKQRKNTSDPREAATPKAPRPTDSEAEAIIAKTKATIEKAKAERDALDQRTGGQYKALMELRGAIAGVMTIEDGERTFESGNTKAGEDWCTGEQLVVLRMVDRVSKAIDHLLDTVFPVPKEWRVVSRCDGVDAAATCVRPARPEIPGKWRVSVSGVKDKDGMCCVWNEINEAIKDLARAPAGGKRSLGRDATKLLTFSEAVDMINEINGSMYGIGKATFCELFKEGKPWPKGLPKITLTGPRGRNARAYPRKQIERFAPAWKKRNDR